jgi:hypothetical protein
MIAILTAASQRVGKCTNAANTTIEAPNIQITKRTMRVL